MIPWTDSVKQSGRLTIYVASLAGTWGHVFRQALHEFNVLCSGHRLGVMITESKHPPEDDAGANISIQTAGGTV